MTPVYYVPASDDRLIDVYKILIYLQNVVRMGAENLPHYRGAAGCGKYAAPCRTHLKNSGARTQIIFSAAPPN